jgi:hypothetical protein
LQDGGLVRSAGGDKTGLLGQKSKISKARSIICYLAIKEMKYSG